MKQKRTSVAVKKKSEIPFLDTMISIKEGYLDTDLYKKETDRNQYLLRSSCHVKQTTTAIPYSLSLRIVRICRDPKNWEKHFQNLKRQLLERDYPEKIIDSAIVKARNVPRKFALQKVAKHKQREGPIFAVTHDPRLPRMESKRFLVNKNTSLVASGIEVLWPP